LNDKWLYIHEEREHKEIISCYKFIKIRLLYKLKCKWGKKLKKSARFTGNEEEYLLYKKLNGITACQNILNSTDILQSLVIKKKKCTGKNLVLPVTSIAMYMNPSNKFQFTVYDMTENKPNCMHEMIQDSHINKTAHSLLVIHKLTLS